MHEQPFKSFVNILHKVPGYSAAADYVEPISPLLFIKFPKPKDRVVKPDLHQALALENIQDIVDNNFFSDPIKYKTNLERGSTHDFKIRKKLMGLLHRIRHGLPFLNLSVVQAIKL